MGHIKLSFDFIVFFILLILSISTEAQNANVTGSRTFTSSHSNTPAVGPNGNTKTTDAPSKGQAGNQFAPLAGLLSALDPTGSGSGGLIGGLLKGLGGGTGGQNFLQQMVLSAAVKPMLDAQNVSDACSNDALKIIDGLLSTKIWALKMIDAMGKPQSGILDTYEAQKWLGSYDECLDIKATGSDVKGKDITYFKGKYCMVIGEIKNLPIIPGGKIPLAEGVCVSDSCSNSDVNGIMKAVQKALNNGTVAVETITYCQNERELTGEAKAVIVILAILGVLLVVGTVYDVIVVQLKWIGSDDEAPQPPAMLIGLRNQGFTAGDEKGTAVEMESKQHNGVASVDTTPGEVVATGGTNVSPTDVRLDVRDNVAYKPREQSVLGKMLVAFSVYSNGTKILGTSQGAGSLGSINGIRFLSMAWVILGHTYFFSRNYEQNLMKHFFVDKMKQWTFMMVPYATVSVDTFFCISGVLVAYLTLREIKKMGGPKKLNWFMFYFHRFWRLTPPYMLILMTGYVLLPYMSEGPAWITDKYPDVMGDCHASWWTNLLYINNYVKTDRMCMGWSWYLSNDMQFYIISPLILLPFLLHFAAGAAMCLVFMAGTLISTGVIARTHKYNAQMVVDAIHPPEDPDSFKNIYIPSYARMGPYIIGLFVGYILYKWKCKLPAAKRFPDIVKRFVNVSLWIQCIFICCVVIYAPFADENKNVFSVNGQAAYLTLSRTAWGVAVGWIVLACACGYGGWINEILSWRPFIPLGRLTYCAYLVHPLVMTAYMRSQRVPYYFTDLSLAYLFAANMVMSYGVAFLCSLAFESPMMGLEKAIFKKGK